MSTPYPTLNAVIAEMKRKGPRSPFSQQVFLSVLNELPPVPNIPGLAIFQSVLKKTVSLSIDFLLIRDGKILLTPRDDQFYTGMHFPGGSRIPGTTLLENAQIIVFRELGQVRVKSLRPITMEDHIDDPRAHHVATLFEVEFQGKPNEGRWVRSMPEDLIPIHRAYWPHVERTLELHEKIESLA